MRPHCPLYALALGASLTFAVACGPTDHRVARVRPTDAGDAALDRPNADVPVGFCDPRAPCRPALVATAFRYAVCACGQWSSAASLVTDSFDSSRGPYTSPGGTAGSVGTNTSLTEGGRFDIRGSLWVGGDAGVNAPAALRVSEVIRSNGDLIGLDEVSAHDAFVNGEVRARDLRIPGVLTLPPGRTITVSGARVVGAERREPVSVSPPCDCDPANRPPIAQLVAARRDDNDNRAAGLTADSLTQASRPARVELACGRYYLRGITGASALTIVALGRVELYVEGRIEMQDDLRVELASGGEIDLFVTENIDLHRGFYFGSPERPARARVFIAGARQIALAGESRFAGNLYAPDTEVQLSGGAEVFGSLLARRFAVSGNLSVHYDRAVLDPGACAPAVAPATCATCRECPGQACIRGRCAACGSDADCCAPLRCASGRCLAEPP